MLPTAIGLIPPSSLLNAHNEAPKSDLRTKSGVLPAKITFVSFVRLRSNRCPFSAVSLPSMSLRTLGLKPSSPPLDPEGIELMAESTVSLSTTKGGEFTWEGLGRLLSVEPAGCFSLSA